MLGSMYCWCAALLGGVGVAAAAALQVRETIGCPLPPKKPWCIAFVKGYTITSHLPFADEFVNCGCCLAVADWLCTVGEGSAVVVQA